VLQLTVEGSDGDDEVSARGLNGSGPLDLDPTLTGPHVDVFLYGGAGNDALLGGPDYTEFVGGPGNDLMAGGIDIDLFEDGQSGGKDILDGGAGDDAIIAGHGSDLLSGGDGVDQINFERSPVGVEVALATGRATGWGSDTFTGFEHVRGSSEGDVLVGSSGQDVLAGLDGEDTIRSLAGNDSLSTGQGSDRLLGGSGGDVLDGGQDADRMSGGGGDDRIYGGLASWPDSDDILLGGSGFDRLEALDRDADRRIDCGPGEDPRPQFDHRIDPRPASC
jgi:Ca2+-binding RTX toxin-like protein